MSSGTLYCIMIRFTDGTVSYYNGKPSHHVYHSPNRLGARKWKTIAGATRALANVPKIWNQEIFVSEV